MTTKGIIFSAPMIRVLLDGRKTQTRRLFKPRGFHFYTHPTSGDRYNQYQPYRDGTWDESRITGSGPMRAFGWGEGLYSYLPYAPGDRLYVRESHRFDIAYDKLRASEISGLPFVWCEADGSTVGGGVLGKLRPSIFMPRWASRLWLEVTDVRVQRVAEIGSDDAEAEGVERHPIARGWKNYRDDRLWCAAPETSFESFWNSLHDKPGERWEDSPWVVAVTFAVHHGNIDTAPTTSLQKTQRTPSAAVPGSNLNTEGTGDMPSEQGEAS